MTFYRKGKLVNQEKERFEESRGKKYGRGKTTIQKKEHSSNKQQQREVTCDQHLP